MPKIMSYVSFCLEATSKVVATVTSWQFQDDSLLSNPSAQKRRDPYAALFGMQASPTYDILARLNFNSSLQQAQVVCCLLPLMIKLIEIDQQWGTWQTEGKEVLADIFETFLYGFSRELNQMSTLYRNAFKIGQNKN